MNYNEILSIALKAAVHAGQAVLEVYETDFDVREKEDHSPLTLADQRSHKIIKNYLQPLNIPVLSEEGKTISFDERKNWERLWIVDPLDGTKEFVKRNDEFTVNIALVESQRSVLGVIYLPVKDTLYFAEKENGAYRLDEAKQHIEDALNRISDKKINDLCLHLISKSQHLPRKFSTGAIFTIVGSRSHATSELVDFVTEKEKILGKVRFISAGSSLKICLVAEGEADIYPRLGPTMEWDTAAGQAIAESAGAKMIEYKTGKPLLYNKKDLLNPWFIVERN